MPTPAVKKSYARTGQTDTAASGQDVRKLMTQLKQDYVPKKGSVIANTALTNMKSPKHDGVVS